MASTAPDDRRSVAVARDLAVSRISSAGLEVAAILELDGLETEVAVRLGHALRDLDAAVAALVTVAFIEEVAAPNNVVTCKHCGEHVYVRPHHYPLSLAERAGDGHAARSFVITGGSALLHQCLIGAALPLPEATLAAGRISFDD